MGDEQQKDGSVMNSEFGVTHSELSCGCVTFETPVGIQVETPGAQLDMQMCVLRNSPDSRYKFGCH